MAIHGKGDDFAPRTISNTLKTKLIALPTFNEQFWNYL